LPLNLLNDEFLLELGHLPNDLLLTGELPSEPGVTPYLLDGGPVVEVIGHHGEHEVLELIRVVFSRVSDYLLLLFFFWG